MLEQAERVRRKDQQRGAVMDTESHSPFCPCTASKSEEGVGSEGVELNFGRCFNFVFVSDHPSLF